MYLHLGRDTVVRTDDVIGIFDVESSSVGRITRDFLKSAEKNLLVTNVTDDLPKSFVVCEEPTGLRVYISQISSSTLLRRARHLEGQFPKK